MTMCVSHVYKRRKLRNSVALLPAEVRKSFYDTCGSSISNVDSDCQSIIMANDEVCKLDMNSFNPADEVSSTKSPVINEKSPTFPLPVSDIPVIFSEKQLEGSRNADNFYKPDEIPFREVGHAQKASEVVGLHLISEHGSSASNDYSSPNSYMEQFALSTGSEAENLTEFSSIDASVEVVVEPLYDSMTTTGLINDQLVGNVYPINVDLPAKSLDRDMTGCCLACQKCNLMGNSSSMLICDLCEKACHLHCCSEKIPLREDWYCEDCSRNGPRTLLDGTSGSFLTVNGQCRRRTLQLELGPILFMLSDTGPYTSKVRIGQSFQAEVPEWPVIPSRNEDSFGEPSILNMEHLPVLRVGDINSYTLHTTGNWVQCRDKHGCGAICGKWRRAPLFVQQTDDWDCSCAVLWDPYHADCAVPQELESEEVLKQLKYVELLRSRFPK